MSGYWLCVSIGSPGCVTKNFTILLDKLVVYLYYSGALHEMPECNQVPDTGADSKPPRSFESGKNKACLTFGPVQPKIQDYLDL